MVGFLLDNNHIDAYCRKVPAVLDRLNGKPHEWLTFACVITLGEIDAGHWMTTTTHQLKREAYERCVNEDFVPIDITITTRSYYGRIMGKIWENHRPARGKDTERHLVENGVDINDVWFVACAWEHNIIAVTNDSMAWIKEAVAGEVRFENWLEQPDPHRLVRWVKS